MNSALCLDKNTARRLLCGWCADRATLL